MSARGAEVRPLRHGAVVRRRLNSVRLVLYRLEGRAIWTVFNEKVLAGLGRDLPRRHACRPTGVAMPPARPAPLRRRAGRRPALDPRPSSPPPPPCARPRTSPGFVAAVVEETGLRIRVLSGDERGATVGARRPGAASPTRTAWSADLGGASLELTCLTDGRPGKAVTLPLGPLAPGRRAAAFNIEKVRKRRTTGWPNLVEGFECTIRSRRGRRWPEPAPSCRCSSPAIRCRSSTNTTSRAADAQAAARG